MAVPCVLYRPEKFDYLSAPTEPWQNSKKNPATQEVFTPNSNFRATPHDLTDVAPDLPTEEALCLEIEKLCTATLVIDEAFYNIGRKLSDASREQNKRADLYDTCRALEAQWNEHHQTYKTLLWRSREFAGEAQAAVDDFRELVLPSLRDKGLTRSEKQKIIQGQLKILQDMSQPSQSLCQEFREFGRALDTYINEFSRIVEGLRIGEQSQEVGDLENRLREARAAMEVVGQEVTELGWKLAADVAVTGTALLLAFVIPVWWAKLACTATIAFSCPNVKHSAPSFFEARRKFGRRSSQTHEKNTPKLDDQVAVKKYKAIKAEYDSEKACLDQMIKLESTLHDSRPLVQEVTTKLGIFVSVWAAITADIRKLKTSLRLSEDPTSPLFILRVQKLEKMYGYLGRALRHYQITICPPL